MANTLVSAEPVSAPAAVSPKRLHLDYLDGVRALAALYVVLHHISRTASTGHDSSSGVNGIVTHLLSYGHWAVIVFIVLSGYCLMLPVARNSGVLRGGVLLFFKKRARRILPPFYFALALSGLLTWLVIGAKTGSPWDDSHPITAFGVVTHLFMLHDLFQKTAHQIDYPLSTVSIEWRIYFLFPLFVMAWQKFGPMRTTLAAMLVSMILYVAIRGSVFIDSSPLFIGMFALGMLGAGISFSETSALSPLRARIPWRAALWAMTGLILLTQVVHFGRIMGSIGTDLLVGLWSFALLVAASRGDDNRLRSVLSWKPFVIIGTFGYSLYLVHAPALELLWHYVLRPQHLQPLQNLAALVLVGLPVIIGFAYLFSLGCERPFLNTPPRKEPALPLVPVAVETTP